MIRIGDKVKGVYFREGTYPECGFDEAMEAFVGVVGVVEQLDNSGFCLVEFDDGDEGYWYPIELLKVVV